MNDPRIFWAIVPLIIEPPKGNMSTTVGYALEERSKNIIEFIIDSAALHIKKEMNAKIRLHDGYGYDIKDINVFEANCDTLSQRMLENVILPREYK